MPVNKDLHVAKNKKKDEFYTQLTDIENELKYYTQHFKGKTVYCNCDDPTKSNFWKYFSFKFERLGLKRLMATCYQNPSPDLFSDHTATQSFYLEYSGDKNGNRVPDPEEIEKKYLKGDGDFRSPECIELLQEADIIVTNPPFSKFREYLAQLMKYNKKFLIIGNMNAVTYKEIFPLIKSNQIWYGPSISSGDREFGVPNDYHLTAASSRTDECGNKFIRVKGVRWFTNLDHRKRHETLPLYEIYSPERNPQYANYDAIEVSRTKEIPENYSGAMGVPISFLDKYNPDQFEIIKFRKGDDNKDLRLKDEDFNVLKGLGILPKRSRSLYFRIIILNKQV